MYKEKMKVLVIDTVKEPRAKTIDGSLKQMQEIVGGYIETTKFCDINGKRMVLVCNEDGKLRGLPLNKYLEGQWIAGTAFVCKDTGDELQGLTDAEIVKIKLVLRICAFAPKKDRQRNSNFVSGK